MRAAEILSDIVDVVGWAFGERRPFKAPRVLILPVTVGLEIVLRHPDHVVFMRMHAAGPFTMQAACTIESGAARAIGMGERGMACATSERGMACPAGKAGMGRAAAGKTAAMRPATATAPAATDMAATAAAAPATTTSVTTAAATEAAAAAMATTATATTASSAVAAAATTASAATTAAATTAAATASAATTVAGVSPGGRSRGRSQKQSRDEKDKMLAHNDDLLLRVIENNTRLTPERYGNAPPQTSQLFVGKVLQATAAQGFFLESAANCMRPRPALT